MISKHHPVYVGFLAVSLLLTATQAAEPILPRRSLLQRETLWDNQDWDWYEANIPFFECPDADIQTTYYYRWELLTKHLTYGSPNSGYSFTEFIDRPFWSGTYGAISCPAGHSGRCIPCRQLDRYQKALDEVVGQSVSPQSQMPGSRGPAPCSD